MTFQYNEKMNPRDRKVSLDALHEAYGFLQKGDNASIRRYLPLIQPDALSPDEIALLAHLTIVCGQLERGLQLLESSLEQDPGCVQAIQLFRQVEQQFGAKYLEMRENQALIELEQAWGTSRWNHVVRKMAAFWNAPRVMKTLQDRIYNPGCPPVPPAPTDSPEVSFIIPMFNRQDSISTTLDSVIRQTCTNWEAIIVDDASTDSSVDVVNNYIKTYPGYALTLITLEQNSGIGAVRNVGVKHARGEYIVLLDSDDSVAPTYLQRLLGTAENHPEAAWIAPLTVQYGDVNRMFGFTPFNLETLAHKNLFNITNLLRRNVYNTLGGFREDMREGFVDWEFWVRAARHGFRPVQLPEVLFFYHRKGEGILGAVLQAPDRAVRIKRQLMESNQELYYPVPASDNKILQQGMHIPPQYINSSGIASAQFRHPSVPDISSSTADFTGKEPSKKKAPGKTRILYVCHDFPPHRFAGAQLYALAMAKRLKALGIDIEVFHPVVRKEFPPDFKIHTETYEGIAVHKLAKEANFEHHKVLNTKVANAFRTFLTKNKYDLIHFHGLGQLSSAPLFIAKEFNYKTIMTMHDFWLLCDQWHMIKPNQDVCTGPETIEKCANCYKQLFQGQEHKDIDRVLFDYKTERYNIFKDAFSHIDIAVAPSRYFRDTYEKYGFKGVRVHRLGIAPFETVKKQKHDRVVFGYLGQLIPRKGIDLLIQAFTMNSDLDNSLLKIFGKSYRENYDSELKRIAGGAKNIEFHGEYKPDDLPRLYSEIDIAVIPTRMDNYPITVLEAFLNNTPVIGSDAGGVPELVHHEKDGLIFKNESVRELHALLVRIQENPELIESLAENIPDVQTPEKDIEQTIKLYESLLNRGIYTVNAKEEPEISESLRHSAFPSQIEPELPSEPITAPVRSSEVTPSDSLSSVLEQDGRVRLAYHYAQRGDTSRAIKHAQLFLQQEGKHPAVEEFLNSLESADPSNPIKFRGKSLKDLPQSPIQDSSNQKTRVLFYFFKNVHTPVLLPIYNEMVKQGSFKIAFAVHPYNEAIRAGFPVDEERKLRAIPVPFVNNPREWKADVSIIADNVAQLLEDCGKIVNVGHGLLSKGQYFTDSDFIHRENLEDLLCVPGPYHKARLLESGKVFIPIVSTGFPKLDSLFSPNKKSREELLMAQGLNPSNRVVLFAPTFNDELSAIPVLKDRIGEVANEHTYLLIKLHGSTRREYKNMYRSLAKTRQNIIYVDDPDLAPSMLMADVMISDVSSAFMEFMSLDKPVILVNNPNRETYPNYDPEDIEYQWRDLGIQVSTIEEVRKAVERCFMTPEEFSEKRKQYADQLLEDRTGHASKNVVETIKKLLKGEYDPASYYHNKTAVLIPVTDDTIQQTVATLQSLKSCGDHAIPLLYANTSDGILPNPILETLTSEAKVYTPRQLEQLQEDLHGFACIACTPPGADLGKRRLFRLVNHLRRTPAIEAVLPMNVGQIPALDPVKLLQLPPEYGTDAFNLDMRLKSTMVGRAAPCEGELERGMILMRSCDKTIGKTVELLQPKTSAMFTVQKAVIALDVVMPIRIGEYVSQTA